MFKNVAEKLPRLMIAFRGGRQRTKLWKLSRLCTSLVCCTGSSGTQLEAGSVLCLLTAASVLCTAEMVRDRMLLLGQTSWWESAADSVVVWQHCQRLGQAEGDGQSGGRACRAPAWPLSACCVVPGDLPVPCPSAPGSRRLLLGTLQTGAGALLPSGTEEADGGTGPALLLPRGSGSRAGGGDAHHSHPDNQGAAAEQRHRRTLQGPGSHAAKVGWCGLGHTLVFPVLDLRHHPSQR